jgi:homoserine dehydrogenase
VITTNKGPVAFAYRSLVRAAERAGRRFLFEGAVMDGVPIFNFARELLPAVRVAAFRGIVNSTTNFILSGLEAGARFDALLRQMQARGIAEADPSLDLDGWDAAAKTAALANVLLDARAARRRRGGVSAKVALEEVPADDFFAHVDGQQNMLVLQTDLLDSIGVVQAGGGLTHTAYALLSDLVAVARSIIAAPAIRQSPTTTRRRRTPSPRGRR